MGSMNVKAFDGSQRAIIGEINLSLQMGPTWFDVEFQVLDISATYNLLLGRPWIHTVGAVDSTLHQAVKFEWNREEVIIHGDGSNPIYTNQTVPFIENIKKLGGETYHRIERVNTIEKDRWWSSKIESILLWTGYEAGKGIGKNLQGITKPVQPQYHGTTFGLGYEYTWQEYQDWSPLRRAPYYPLEQLVPPLHQTFHQADRMWGFEEDEVLAGMRKLFLDEEDMDCNAIDKEEEEDLTIQTMEERVVLNNWTVAPSQARRVPGYPVSGIIITYLDESMTVTCNETTQPKDSDSKDLEDDIIPEKIIREVKNFENKPKSNLEETEAVSLGDSKTVKETRISIHLSPSEKEEYIRFLKEYEDVFAWSYSDMTSLSISIVAHKLPTNPMCPPVKRKLKKFKQDMSLKIKEEVTKKIKAKALRVVEYPTWLANIVPVLKKDGKVRVCVDYRDLNRASPKDDFPLPNIHILIDNCAKHELQYFVDCFEGYHQILMNEEDAEKTAFITPWGIYCYKMILFGLKNAGATYMRAMTTIFHDMIHKEIEVYVDDVIIKSKRSSDRIADLKKFFDRLRKYNLKLNPAKCAFGVLAGKLLGFIVSHRGIELDPSKVKAIQGLPPPKNKKEVLGEWATKNTKILPYLHCVQELIKRFTKIEFKHVPRIQNEFPNALATLSSMIQHPDKNFIDLIPIGIHKQPIYYAHVEEDIDGNPWFHDIKKYLEKGEYPESTTHT
ncbi:uncharacterized protein [Nicotiana tomentosiformis]|uniref:uncharacterized protein n=1 Tax=Nicotiana tomentosiformis TaxID=4098 RepID=UPI00388C7809